MRFLLQVGEPPHTAWMFDWERAVLLWINSHHHPLLDYLLVPVSFIGEWGACWIVLIVSLFLWGKPEQKRVAVGLGLAMLAVSLCVILPLRHFFPRERPFEVLPSVRQLGLALTGDSFPSGHVQSACLVAVALGARWRRFAPALASFALLVGYSRLYCGMHYPLDVFVGALIGISSGVILLHVPPWQSRAPRGPPSLGPKR